MNSMRIENTITILVLTAIALIISVSCLAKKVDRLPIPSGASSFDGDSRSLRTTNVVPTLDASIDRQSNVVWCASFLAAWKVLETDVTEEPPSLQDSPQIALALNMASDPRLDIPEESLYAAAGWNQKGITDRIVKDLAIKFPSKAPPTFSGILPDSLVTYAYLESNIKFSLPYFQSRKPLLFTDHRGVKTELNSFGIRVEDDYAYFELRNQPQILYEAHDDNYKLTECIIDLDRTSSPNQVILALVMPKSTLAETLSFVEDKINAIEDGQKYNGLGPNDALLVPDMVWHITHHFTELEGKEFKNSKLKGQRIDVAQQDIQFRLDRSGTELKSEAKTFELPIPTYYMFDRPFLLQMKKRGAEMPYFVMWVENAELLTKWDLSKSPNTYKASACQ